MVCIVGILSGQVQSPIACDGFYQLADIVVLKANFHPVLVGDGDADIIPTDGDLSVSSIWVLCKDDFAVVVIAILPNEASFVGDGSNAAIGVVGKGDNKAHRVSDGMVSDVVEGDGSVVTYNYDPLFRLIREQRVGSYPYTVSYEYDGAGNRMVKVWDGRRTDYVYDRADRLQFYVEPDGSVVAYEWDGNGNMVARVEGNQRTQFEYDYDNRLVRIVYPNGNEVRFGYDGLGRRVFRQEGSNVRYFYYDGDKIIAEREGSDWVVRYLLGVGLWRTGRFASTTLIGLRASDG